MNFFYSNLFFLFFTSEKKGKESTTEEADANIILKNHATKISLNLAFPLET